MSTVARRYFTRGLEALRRGDLEAAREELRGALDLAPDFVHARIGYASVLAHTGDVARAVQLLRDGLAAAAARRGPRMVLQRALGDVLIAAGDYRGAESAFVEAAALAEHDAAERARTGRPPAPSPVALHDRLARLHAKSGRYTEALDELLAASRTR